MGALPNIEQAVQQAAGFVQATWQRVVMGQTQVPGATTPQCNVQLRALYADSIVTDNMIVGQGSVAQRVLTVKQIARDLENGKGKWDMKEMLLSGPKARHGKNGRYNIIPFRHGTSDNPNSWFKKMPNDIYKQARQLKETRTETTKVAVAGKHMRQVLGDHIQQHKKTLQWGGRLTGTEATHPKGANAATGQGHKAGKYEGMTKNGAKGQTQYMTFRVVSDSSPTGSWWHPGYQAHHIAQGVADFCRPAVEKMIGEAAAADMVSAIATIGRF